MVVDNLLKKAIFLGKRVGTVFLWELFLNCWGSFRSIHSYPGAWIVMATRLVNQSPPPNLHTPKNKGLIRPYEGKWGGVRLTSHETWDWTEKNSDSLDIQRPYPRRYDWTPKKIASFNPKNLSRYGWMSQGLLTHTKWAQKPATIRVFHNSTYFGLKSFPSESPTSTGRRSGEV